MQYSMQATVDLEPTKIYGAAHICVSVCIATACTTCTYARFIWLRCAKVDGTSTNVRPAQLHRYCSTLHALPQTTSTCMHQWLEQGTMKVFSQHSSILSYITCMHMSHALHQTNNIQTCTKKACMGWPISEPLAQPQCCYIPKPNMQPCILAAHPGNRPATTDTCMQLWLYHSDVDRSHTPHTTHRS